MTDKYKIMIVDDEEEVREGIARKIRWEELGFEIVATAENGEDALEKADEHDLDLVLTDIKMPFMDGLQLGEELRKRYPNIKLIIFTGFDEFEYAKQAISLNVVEYVLKPVNEQELSAILARVKQALDDNIARKRDVDALRESYERSLPLLRERFINELLWGLVPRGDIEQKILEFGLPFVKGKQKNVMVLEVDLRVKEQYGMEQELVPTSVKRIADAHCAERCVFESFVSSKKIVVITEWGNKNPIGGIMELANEICDECRRVLSLRVAAGVGRCCDSVSGLALSFGEAEAALEYKAVTGWNSPIYIRDMEMLELEPSFFDTNAEKKLASTVKFGSDTEIEEAVGDIIDQLERQSGDSLSRQAYLIGVFSGVIKLIERMGVDEAEVLGDGADRYFRLSADYDLNELRDWLVSVCVRMSRCASEKRVSTEERLIADAKEYINLNYQNHELSVDVLCEYLHISQSYFSTLFKKVTQNTYINYLTEIRLQKAVELLEHTDEKTYLIANSVGYDEPNYFSYVFKKRFGKTPSQHRAALSASKPLEKE